MIQAHESATRRVIIYNIYKHINDLHLSDGETKRMKCPNCGERTFTVTNNMGTILWNCYKLSCNVSGQKRVRLSVDDIKARQKGIQKVREEFELPGDIVPLRNNHILIWNSIFVITHANATPSKFSEEYSGNTFCPAAKRKFGVILHLQSFSVN